MRWWLYTCDAYTDMVVVVFVWCANCGAATVDDNVADDRRICESFISSSPALSFCVAPECRRRDCG